MGFEELAPVVASYLAPIMMKVKRSIRHGSSKQTKCRDFPVVMFSIAKSKVGRVSVENSSRDKEQ